MTGLLPLLIMWLYSRGSGSPITPSPTAPQWPTAASPPPMPPALPAFASQPPPKIVHASADPTTSLSDLHKAPPKPPPPDKHSPAATSLKAAAARAARGIKLPSLHAKAAAPAQKSAAVLDLQTILNVRGAKLARDGKYGPKTANAWTTVARSKGLPPTISRVGPTTARVVTQTYDILAVPPIP